MAFFMRKDFRENRWWRASREYHVCHGLVRGKLVILPVMNTLPTPRLGALRLFRRLQKPDVLLASLPRISVPALAIRTVTDPVVFRQQLLAQIASARQRIHIAALYLQDDSAGREVMDALYQAKSLRPDLDIAVFVDWHRAQRGLIGKDRSEGNAAMYCEYAERLGDGVQIYGVPVKSREIFGVLHLKGFVIDDTVIYSGASLNDVYLARHGRYRLDRYHFIQSPALADCLSEFMLQQFRNRSAVNLLQAKHRPTTQDLQPEIRQFRQQLQEAQYRVPAQPIAPGAAGITPLLGFGRGNNQLNATVLALLRSTRQRLTILTPYFNLPRPVRAVLRDLLHKGCDITIIVGDKTANDFYIPPDEPFKTIGLLPYLYEHNLRRFAWSHQHEIDEGRLDILLWRHGSNSYHLKGLWIDDDQALLTGSNINPRAWSLDLENGLLLHDPQRLLRAQHEAELDAIKRHTRRLAHYSELETTTDYPPPVQKMLKRIKRVSLDRLLNRLL